METWHPLYRSYSRTSMEEKLSSWLNKCNFGLIRTSWCKEGKMNWCSCRFYCHQQHVKGRNGYGYGYGYAHRQQTRMAHVVWQQLKFRMTVIPHGATEETVAGSPESREMTENKERDGALTRKNKSCRQPVLQGSHLQGIGNKKNRLDTERIIQRTIQMEREKGCQKAGRAAQENMEEEEDRMRQSKTEWRVAKCAVGWLE